MATWAERRAKLTGEADSTARTWADVKNEYESGTGVFAPRKKPSSMSADSQAMVKAAREKYLKEKEEARYLASARTGISSLEDAKRQAAEEALRMLSEDIARSESQVGPNPTSMNLRQQYKDLNERFVKPTVAAPVRETTLEDYLRENEALKTDIGRYNTNLSTYSEEAAAMAGDNESWAQMLGYAAQKIVQQEIDEKTGRIADNEVMIKVLTGERNSDFGAMSRYNPSVADQKYRFINGEADSSGGSEAQLAMMGEAEIARYNYLVNTGDTETAERYIELLMPTLKQREYASAMQDAAEFAERLPIIASVASVPANLVGGVTGMVGNIGSQIVTGEVDETAWYNRPTSWAGAARTAVSEGIEDPVLRFMYDTTMSTADFAAQAAIGGGAAKLASLAGPRLANMITASGVSRMLMSSSAATSAIIEAKQNGLSDEDAMFRGVLAAALENFTEKYSLEVILASPKSTLSNLLRSAAAEGSEEVASNVLNRVAETLTYNFFDENAENEFVDEVKMRVANGSSGLAALVDTIGTHAGEYAMEDIKAGLAGAISGAAAHGGFELIGASFGNYGKQYLESGKTADELIETALADSGNAEAFKLAESMRGGKTPVNNYTVGELLFLVVNPTVTPAVTLEDASQKYSSEARTMRNAYKEGQDVGEYDNAFRAAVEMAAAGENEESIRERSAYLTDDQREAAVNAGRKLARETVIGASKKGNEAYDTSTTENASEGKSAAPAVENTLPANDNTDARVAKITSIKDGDIAIMLGDGSETNVRDAGENTVVEEEAVTLEDTSKKYGAQAMAMVHTYIEGQDVAKYDAAYGAAYDMGKSGVPLSYAKSSESTSYLTDNQRELAYEAGVAAADTAAKAQAAKNLNKVNGKTGRKKGVVKGEGVKIDDLKKTFNDPQGKAYKYLSTVAEATGIDIVLYKSEANADGVFEGSQGKFKWSDDKIYIDVNAGLYYAKDVNEVTKYAMLRTFAHEFTHFIEKWNPVQYNEFRKVVFDTLTERGENVHDLIEQKRAQDSDMTYDQASREVVAEAMTDVLPDANFVQTIAEKHKNIFTKLLDKLKEFVQNLHEYFNSIANNPSREANSLKEQVGESVKYVESIVQLFDNVAVEAVENYQQTVAVGESSVPETKNITQEAVTEEIRQEVKEEAKSTETVSYEPKITTSENGYSITDNPEYGSIEVKFEEKPSESIRDVLKANKFRWNGKRQVWYGKTTHEEILGALDKAYEAESEPVKETISPSDFETAFWNATQEERNEVVDAINQNTKIEHIAPTEIREIASAVNNEEVNTNVEEETGAVLPHRSDGQGTARLLADAETGNVQGDGAERNPVADAGERGLQAGRHDLGTDAGERTERGHGEGNSQSGDLRRDDGLTAEEPAPETAEPLHDEVAKQVAQKSTEQPKGRNFVIGDSLDLPAGEKARYKANVAAIRLVKQLEAENRYATEAEQAILSKYVGWGGLANAFDQRKADWNKEYAELKELLTDEEYSLARGSTLNAHYTEISVIKAMYDGLARLGFDGGRLLEPSSGVGNFVGAMPADMSAKVKSWTMVELDSITGKIAKYLYPNADVRIQGFETANIPNNYMDVAISNVPFGNYPITDKSYPKKVTSAIHNYFFAKSLDKVRPGGIVMFITSSYTMNSKDSTVRRYIMQRADLLGAIRLPDTAFKGNAGTEVVTDILILKKRAANTDYAGEDFLEAPWTYPVKGNYRGANINTYFETHPEMVLGAPSMEGSMYRSDSLTYKAFTDRGSLADQIREAFTHITGKMDYQAQTSPEKTNFAVERAGKKTKKNGLVVHDGKVYQNTENGLTEVNVPKGAAERISGMLEMRDAAKELMTYQQQGLNDSEIKKARQKLNKLYDAFVKKHGFINSQANRNAMKDDPYKFSIFALENYNPETKKGTKADIFSKNTIAANRTITSAKDVAEGLIVSVNQTGRVDTTLIAKLTGKTVENVTRELLDSRQVFKNRDGELEPAEVYLSGNVRAKLRDAEALVPLDADYQKNVEALKNVVPEDVPYQDIFVNPGTPWIPNSVYSDFAAHMLGSRNTQWSPAVEVTRNPETGNFTVELKNRYLKTNAANTQKWGTSRRSFLDLFDAMLNSRSVVIKYKTDDGATVVDKDATAAANEKIENIQKEFQEWLWKDEARRNDLAYLYNETFNAIVTPKYNGDNLTVNGANAMKPLRPHQRNAVQRIISSGGNTLLAHKVGAGKTYEMAAAAMKLKQLGLVKKPMFAVPKSLVAQWGNEFMDFFPTAKLLVAEASDFTAANRKVFMNRIANGDYDAVIVSYEQFEKLPVSNDFARELYQEQIDTIIRAIEEAKAEKGGKSLSVKDLEKKRKSLQARIDKLTDTAKDEDNIDFEQLGVDSLFIDEAHNFKNLFYTTSMTNVAGLGNKDGSKRAFDLYTKVRYLQKLNGGRGIVFATATPVMNSMSEMYIMQKYLQPDLLEQLGLNTFDAWAKQFGEVVNGVEIKPSGQGYRVKQSFSRFKNMSELQLLFRNFADVLTDIPGLKIPKMKGGKVNVVVCEPGQFQKDYMKELEKRADNIKNVDPSVDNMLKITSDGRKISYTQRMIDPSLPYEEGCKIYRCADNVARVYEEDKANKGTQLIFCDMATPKGKSSTSAAETEDVETDMESAKLYDDIKARLMKNGIPAKEIAFIHDADTDAKKKKLFADVNDGKVRVLIGSTGKMGVGMNAQKRVAAIHHLDAPWRPGDVEQRNGRAFRQGNIHDEVECFTYVTEGSFDARLWDILERKQNFINQVMNGENVGRETEDTGEVTLSAAEVKALASGSPLIMEQVQLDTDIKKLESLRRAHISAVANAKSRLEQDKGAIANLEIRIANGKADIKTRMDTYSDGKFSLTVGKQKYTEKKDAGVALMAAAAAKATEDGYTTIARFAGFDLRVVKTHEGIKGLVTGAQSYSFNTYPGNTTFMVNHLISIVEGLNEKVELWEKNLVEVRNDMAEQENLIAVPFAKQAELDKKRARYNEVMEILNPKEEQIMDGMDEDAEQHQQRTNTLTDREVLALAAEQVQTGDLTAGERDALDIFQQRLVKLNDLEEQRAEQGRLYKEQQFGAKVDRAAAAKTLNRMHLLDEQIQKASADVLTVEDKAVLKNVLKKARKVVEKQQFEHDQETLQRWRKRRNDAAAIKKYRERVRRDVDELTNWVLHPNNKDVVKHIPDALKDSVISFLASINFMSKQSLNGGNVTVADKAFQKQLESLNAALKQNIDTYGLYSGYTDLPPDFMDRLQTFIKSVDAIVEKNSGEFVINDMTSGELKELSKVVRTLKDYIQQFNRFHVNAMFQHVYEAGDDTIGELARLNNASEHTGNISNFVFWQQIRPAYAFERFGKGGKSIYDGLRQGQAKLAFNTKAIVDFSEKVYTAKEVNAWEKEVKEIKLGGETVKIRVSQIMSFYELSKRPQALGHILGQGIRVATYKDGMHKVYDVGHAITQADMQTVIDTLTPRQKEVADKLQKFMAEQGGKWGNYVSVKRFGEEMFGEEHYFPINSDGRHLQANADEYPSAASLYALLNMSFTKELQENANNQIILYSIFDVFSNHMASMAQYNAFALPVLDALKWFNYQQRSEPDENGKRFVLGSVRDQMARVYGTPEESRPGSGKKGYAEIFVENILKAFNGTEAQGTSYDGIGMKLLNSYNRAQVAYNFRVVVQQPLAITRAGMLVDFRSIVQGMKLSPAAIRSNIEEMRKHSGIAAWKDLGFYDVNISRGLNAIIKHSDTATDKLIEFGMKGAESADTITWAGIWSACKEEVIRKQHLKPKDDGFYEAVTTLFEDVIYKTQVVDSVLTKNEFMRDKGFFARSIGSFMSEPTTTASMVIDAVDKYNLDRQRGLTRQQAWKKNSRMIARTMYVYGVSAVLLAAVQAAADALRDDDDYQDLLEKWLEAFGGNIMDELMPFNKLPILSDFCEVAKELIATWTGLDIYGNAPRSVVMQWYDVLVKGSEILHDKITGEDTNYTWYSGIYKLLQAVSGMTGLPMAAATREIVNAWNNTVGAMAPSLKVKTYDPGEKNEIKYAYQDGYLTDEEATALLLEKGLVDTEDEAYWTIQGWEAGDGYSRYDAIFEAVRTGTGFDAAMAELTSHGYTEKDVLSRVKSQIGEWYTGGEITKQQAIDMMTRYLDMDSDDITAAVNKWSCEVVTGTAYDDIKQEYLDGNITADRAIEMRVRYGGEDAEKAAKTVNEWRAEKELGIAYDDINEAFMDGELTETDVWNIYTTYGGYSEAKATEKVAVLAFVKAHPDCDGISYAAVEDYTTYCEPVGVPAKTFYNAWEFNNSTKADVDANGDSISGSKKVKVLAYINTLDLTYAQKDSLYYAFGWAESKIYEAPWH